MNHYKQSTKPCLPKFRSIALVTCFCWRVALFKQWLSLQQAYTRTISAAARYGPWIFHCIAQSRRCLPSVLVVKYKDTRKIYYICLTVALQVIGAVSAAGPQKNHLHSRFYGLGSLRCVMSRRSNPLRQWICSSSTVLYCRWQQYKNTETLSSVPFYAVVTVWHTYNNNNIYIYIPTQ